MYKIYRTPPRHLSWFDNFWDRLFRIGAYTVADPDGRFVEITATLAGARRAVTRHKKHRNNPKWWEEPVVEEVLDD